MKAGKAAAIATALAPAVNRVIACQAVAAVLRERADAIQTRLLAETVYVDQYTGERITIPKDAWCMGDDQAPGFYDALDAAYREAGYDDLPPGVCPALQAESDLIEAQNRLIKESEPFFGVTNEALLCGTKTKGGLETRREFLDLLCKLVVNRPGSTLSSAEV